MVKKIDTCETNPQNPSTALKTQKKCMMYIEVKAILKKFYESLREYTMKIINFKKKKIKLVTKEQQES